MIPILVENYYIYVIYAHENGVIFMEIIIIIGISIDIFRALKC